MVTADDQIRGCTALLRTRLTKESKATAFYNRGNAYVAKNDFGRAMADYSDALALKADYAPALFNRAVAQRVTGNAQAAINDYTAALAITPADADAFAGRGIARASLAKHSEALDDFSRAIEIKPGHLLALTNRGHAYVRAHRWALAIADYSSAIAISTASVEAIYGRGVAKVYNGDMLSGQTDMTQAMIIELRRYGAHDVARHTAADGHGGERIPAGDCDAATAADDCVAGCAARSPARRRCPRCVEPRPRRPIRPRRHSVTQPAAARPTAPAEAGPTRAGEPQIDVADEADPLMRVSAREGLWSAPFR